MSGASAEAIQHHYDVSNEFYRLWLDPTMTYSSALFEEGDSLEEAQVRKLDYHAAQARAAGKACILDIGCGWGSVMNRLVQHHGVTSTVGLTLSHQQAEYVAHNSPPEVQVREESWRDHRPTQKYDGIISIGAFEHFARPDMRDVEQIRAYREFFQACYDWLKPGTSLSLQTIAYGRARRKSINGFILEHIFPESDLPTLSSIVAAFDGLFELEFLRNDRKHYAQTFRCWADGLYANREKARELVGPEQLGHYEKYHGLFTLGFHGGAMDLLRLTLRRID